MANDMTGNITGEQRNQPVLVAGGGIGGLAAALALVRQGFRVKVLEQAAEIGEIGAGIQLGPNAFHAFDALGIGDTARARAVYTDHLVMHDALDACQVGKIPTGEARQPNRNRTSISNDRHCIYCPQIFYQHLKSGFYKGQPVG